MRVWKRLLKQMAKVWLKPSQCHENTYVLHILETKKTPNTDGCQMDNAIYMDVSNYNRNDWDYTHFTVIISGKTNALW